MHLIDIAKNLIDEREKLGYSRKNFAAQTNVSNESIRLYEAGKVNMSAEFLLAAIKLGVDIQYLFTGVRSENLHRVSEKIAEELNKSIQNIEDVISDTFVNSDKAISGTMEHHVGSKCSSTSVTTGTIGTLFINDIQIEKLHLLVNEIIRIENIVKKKPRTARSVWQSLSAYCQTNSYKFIESQDYQKAELFLKKWIGQLTAQCDIKNISRRK